MQIKSLRPKEMSNKRLSRPAKTVHRIYGGHLSHRVVKDRIVRAFLIEEQKIIKKVCFQWQDALSAAFLSGHDMKSINHCPDLTTAVLASSGLDSLS